MSRDRESPAAWATLEQRVRIWARGSLRTRSWDLVDDAVADTCAGVALDFHRAHGADTFAGFVYGHFMTARRRLLRNHAQRAMSSLDGIDVPAPNDDEEVTTERVTRVYGALAQLPRRERTAVVLRYLESATTAQIAAELGVSEVNARQLVFRGLTRLRALVRVVHPVSITASELPAQALIATL